MQGQGVSSGIAIAPIAFYKRQSVVEEKTSACADEEWQRFCTASKKAQSELERLTEKARQEAGEEASLLFETHQEDNYDLVWVVTADRELRKQRVMARDNISPEIVDLMIESQSEEDVRTSRADLVFCNDGSVEDLRRAADKALSEL
jgi:phosphotransferase system enzyme I (PtsI)